MIYAVPISLWRRLCCSPNQSISGGISMVYDHDLVWDTSASFHQVHSPGLKLWWIILYSLIISYLIYLRDWGGQSASVALAVELAKISAATQRQNWQPLAALKMNKANKAGNFSRRRQLHCQVQAREVAQSRLQTNERVHGKRAFLSWTRSMSATSHK